MLLNSAYEEKNFAIFSNKIIINKNGFDSADITSIVNVLTIFRDNIDAYGKIFDSYEVGMAWDDCQELTFIDTPDMIIIGAGWITNQLFFDLLNDFLDEKLSDYLVDIHYDGN